MSVANILTVPISAPAITPQYAGIGSSITGTATSTIGVGPNAITFGGGLAGAILEPNAVYLFTASLFIIPVGVGPGTDTLDFVINCSTITNAGVRQFNLPIPFLPPSGGFVSVTGTISNGDTVANSLAGVIEYSAPGTYSTIQVRKPTLLRIA